MYKVARQYEVTIKELMEWNNKEDFNVSVGEKLTIRKHP
jgi:membrane-bound lytic murein transglycosylase D